MPSRRQSASVRSPVRRSSIRDRAACPSRRSRGSRTSAFESWARAAARTRAQSQELVGNPCSSVSQGPEPAVRTKTSHEPESTRALCARLTRASRRRPSVVLNSDPGRARLDADGGCDRQRHPLGSSTRPSSRRSSPSTPSIRFRRPCGPPASPARRC
jgi:hypothetical protein